MKIAMVTGCEQSVPPAKYGGTERIVDTLAKELVAMGHDVTLYASGDSKTPAKLFPCTPEAIRTLAMSNDDNIRQALNLQALESAVEDINKTPYDIIDNHAGWQFLLFENLFTSPMVTTLHNTIDKDSKLFSAEHLMYEKHSQSNVISISDSQRRHSSKLNYVATIYHGLDTKEFAYNNEPKDYLVFLGRIHPSKGPEHAIKIAQETGQRLILAARLDPPDVAYYEKKIKPFVDGKQIVYVGEIDQAAKIALVKDARALLSPLTWDEPFGIVNIEALACGTPVIGIRRGSLPEIIEDGKTGFLCDNFDQMAARVKDIDTLSREACRAEVERRFTARHMAEQYLETFQQLSR